MSIDNGSRRRLVGGVTRVVLCLAIAAVMAAVALTQSSPNVHAKASIIQSWSSQVEAAPARLGSTSLNSGGSTYSPFKIRIDSVEASGQLNVEEKEEVFLLNKETELILVIPKEAFDGQYTFRHREKPTGGSPIRNTIELRSANPDVSLCQFNDEREYECKTEITTNRTKINVKGQDLDNLAKLAGFSDQIAVETLLSFDLDGKIDGQPFLVEGRVIFDNTNQRAFAIYEGARARKRPLEIFWGTIGILLPFAIATVLVVPILWFGMKKSHR